MATNAKHGKGTKLQYRSAVGPDVWTTIAEITKLRPFAKTVEEVDGSSQDSTEEHGIPVSEKIAGRINNGDCSFDLNYRDTAATHEFLEANAGNMNIVAGQENKFRVVFPGTAPTKKVKTFGGFIKSVGPEVPFDGKMTCSAVIAISGVVTTTADGS